MPTLNSGEIFTCRGTVDVSSGTFTGRAGQFSRTLLTQEDNTIRGVTLSELRVWDDLTSSLPGTAAADDLAIIEGTYGTDAPTVQSSDSQSTSVTQYARFFIPIDHNYVSGETMQIRIRGGMITTIADTSATVDLSIYTNDRDGAVGSDLCATAAQSINSLTKANADFTVTTTSLVQGDVLDVRLVVAIVDSSASTAVIGEVSYIGFMRDTKG